MPSQRPRAFLSYRDVEHEAGDREKFAQLPLGVTPETAFDMTEPAWYGEPVRIIALLMLQGWDGDDPLIWCDLPEFVDLYTGLRREKGGSRATTPVEDWKADAVHTRMFFDAIMSRFRQP